MAQAAQKPQVIQFRRAPIAYWSGLDFIPRNGEPIFETDTNALKIGDGITTWADLPYVNAVTIEQQVPPGAISQYAGSTTPSGYLLCDGQSVSTTTYAALFAAIGYQYGGSGSSFNLPNLKGRIPVGRDSSQTEFDTLGEIGGAKTHTLTVSEMPSHTHIQDLHTHPQNPHTHTQAAHSHTVNNHAHDVPDVQYTGSGSGAYVESWSGGSGGRDLSTGGSAPGTDSKTPSINSETATNQSTRAVNQNEGGGEAHNNLQPYIVVNYIIKT